MLKRLKIGGRWSLPLLWLAAAVALYAATLTPAPPAGQVVYHVVTRAHVGQPLALWAALCAVFYALLSWVRAPYSVVLGLMHLGVTVIGAALMLAPAMILRTSGLPAGPDAVSTAALFSRLQGIGQIVTWAGLVVLAGVLVQMVVRSWRQDAAEAGSV